mgnify:CR=1 FL=1
MMENIKPMDIEKRSFEIITELLGERKLDPENELVIKRVIHTSADFDYAKNLRFTPGAVQKAVEALHKGACLVTDTNMALAGITITDERKKAIDFSDGYYKSGLLVMVKANNNDVKSVKDLDGKVVAVKSGTGSVDYAKANIKTKDLRQFPNIDNAYMELGTNRADAVLHDTPNILYFIKTAGNGQFKAVGDSLEAQQYGIAFPKGSDELRDKVNGALKTLRENGTYNEIYKKWFGTEPK